MNVPDIMSNILVRYALAQAALLPLMLFSWIIIPRHASLRFQWAFHRVLVVLTLVLPILLAIPGASRIVHVFDRRGPTTAISPMEEPAPASVDDGAPFSPAPPVDSTVPTAPKPSGSRPVTVSPSFALRAVLESIPAGLGVLSLLGLLGFLAVIGRQAARERRLRASASSDRRIGKVRFIASAAVRSPFSTGFLRPRIYLPDGIARSSDRRRMVLAHEAVHVRCVHLAWTCLERLHAALFWYNPLAHLAATNGARLRELVCDRSAGERHGDVAYCQALLDAAVVLAARPRLPDLANGWIGNGFMKRRIEYLAGGLGRSSRQWVLAVAGIAALAGAAVLFGCASQVLPAPAAQEPAVSTSGVATVTTLTNLQAPYPEYRDAVIDTAPTGWNLGTGRMSNFWAGPERTLVLGVENPEGFWLRIEDGGGVAASAFSDDLHAIVSGILLHLPFLQRIWAEILMTKPDLQGDTGFVLSVDSHGAVTSAEPDPAKPGNRLLADAYAASMRTWKLTARDLTTDYRVRIPISSTIRTDGGFNRLEVSLGDAVAEVPANAMSSASLNSIGGSYLQEAFYKANTFVPEDIGIGIISIALASDGTIQRARLLDTDLEDSSRVTTLAREIEGLPPLAPPGKAVGIVLIYGWVPGATGKNIRFWYELSPAFAIGTDAVRYYDTARGGYSDPVKLSLPFASGIFMRTMVTESVTLP